MTPEDKRTKELERTLGEDYEFPLIDGYALTYHAGIRMVARRIEIDWVRDVLTKPGRPCSTPGTKKHFGDMAMVIVANDSNTIITVGYGVLNGGVE